MTISVIIPALNEEKIIAETLERLIDVSGTEVIVADGGARTGAVRFDRLINVLSYGICI